MMLLALITLLLSPWHGPSLPTATPNAVKYNLTVHGAANQTVHLRTEGLPHGWVASFCTKDLCSPFRYDMQLNASGFGSIEFQLVRTDDSALRHVRARIAAPGARSLDVRA